MKNQPPPRQRPKDLAGYLETLSRPVFQAGMSSRVIDAKWDGMRDAFADRRSRHGATSSVDSSS